MFRLTIDHRIARKATTPADVFDLGAGQRNCIDCSGRSKLRAGLGYVCANFPDEITGAYQSAAEVRIDADQCGVDAIGFVYEPAVISTDLPGSCSECAHSVHGKERNPASYKYCARAIDPKTGNLHVLADIRGDDTLCGPDGKWFEPAPSKSRSIFGVG